MCVVISTLLSFFLTSVEFQISNIKLQKIMIKNEKARYIKLFFFNRSLFFLFFFLKKKKKKKKNLNPSILWTGRRVKPNWLESNHDPTWGKGVVVETPDSPEYYRLPTWDNCPAELLLVLAPSQCRCTVMYISSKAKKTSWLSLLPRSDS
jgi:hypothetical protein